MYGKANFTINGRTFDTHGVLCSSKCMIRVPFVIVVVIGFFPADLMAKPDIDFFRFPSREPSPEDVAQHEHSLLCLRQCSQMQWQSLIFSADGFLGDRECSLRLE